MKSMILERLSEEPILSRRTKLAVVYELVRKHYDEIEEARSRGYTWDQIDRVCLELWKDEGARHVRRWKSSNIVEGIYRAIKNGTTLHGKKPVEPLRFSVEVKKH